MFLGRKVKLTLYTPAEFRKPLAINNALVTRVMLQPKIWLIGNEEQLHAASV